MSPNTPPPNRHGHKIVVAGEAVVVRAVRHEHGRDVWIGANGIAWVVAR